MSNEILLSLCIPTNGMLEWVRPVLDSIYNETNPIGNFEVIVTDNGENKVFHDFMMTYSQQHDNLIYKKTNAIQFENQIEAFKLASGEFIKFVNHRMVLLPGALNYLLDFVKKNMDDKPFVYFLDNKSAGEYNTFDSYVRAMSYWSSYSGGVAMWKKDFEKMDLSKPCNSLFPHTNMIFSVKNNNKYIINGHKIMGNLPTDETKKGKYNLFYAFGVEYLSILLDLYRCGDISCETFEKVKNDNYEFLSDLYFKYIILKNPCSYDLENYKGNLKVYYDHQSILIQIMITYMKKFINKIFR